MVEGAAKKSFLPSLGVDLRGLGNLTIMPNSPDPRRFYRMTKLLLMPSLMENAGFVAMEAMTNGIPVLASNRGGLPETVGDAAPMIEIPVGYTPETRELPTAEEVEPWIKAIVRLWDDRPEYERWRQAALARAGMWSAERLGPVYLEFFGRIWRQPSPVAPRK
jgi:glycosyltransferase involved in cell wall biosynthesis